jgi:hypothetical protein
MSTADHHLNRGHHSRDDGLTLDPQEFDRIIKRQRAINAVEAKWARLLNELEKEMEAKSSQPNSRAGWDF